MQADAVLMVVDPDNQIMQVVGFPIDWNLTPDVSNDWRRFTYADIKIPDTDWGEERRNGWRAILELPDGCYEWDLPTLGTGDSLSFENGGGETILRECTSRGSFVEAQSEVANADR